MRLRTARFNIKSWHKMSILDHFIHIWVPLMLGPKWAFVAFARQQFHVAFNGYAMVGSHVERAGRQRRSRMEMILCGNMNLSHEHASQWIWIPFQMSHFTLSDWWKRRITSIFLKTSHLMATNVDAACAVHNILSHFMNISFRKLSAKLTNNLHRLRCDITAVE